jgi:hypothetical protein
MVNEYYVILIQQAENQDMKVNYGTLLQPFGKTE